MRFVDGSSLEVHGAVATEVQDTAERLLDRISPVRAVSTTGDSVWISGTFYLLAAMVSVIAVLAIVNIAPGWLVIPTLAGAILVFLSIGFVVLRHSDRISEKGLLTGIREILKRVWGLGVLVKHAS
jgi:hypothetical protein